MRLYVAGPMSPVSFGHATMPDGWDFNYPAFDAAAADLRAAGFEVANPAEPGDRDGWQWDDYLRRALMQVVTSHGVAVLAGWERSKGARLEVKVAQQLGMPVQTVGGWLSGRAVPSLVSRFADQAGDVVTTEWLSAVAPG